MQEDGAYITYTLPGGADPVTKKLGNDGSPYSVTSLWTNITPTEVYITLNLKILVDGLTKVRVGSVPGTNKPRVSFVVNGATVQSIMQANTDYAISVNANDAVAFQYTWYHLDQQGSKTLGEITFS